MTPEIVSASALGNDWYQSAADKSLELGVDKVHKAQHDWKVLPWFIVLPMVIKPKCENVHCTATWS